MRLLGDLRAPEGVDVLAERIGFPFVDYPEAADNGVGDFHPIFSRDGKQLPDYLPAINALKKIGKACIFPVAKKLASTTSRYEFDACEAVLSSLDQSNGIQLDGALDWAYWHAIDDNRRKEMQETRRKCGIPSVPVGSR
jgi:hypothetical protein